MLVQFATLPFRFDPENGLQILLITSRNTGRWLIPKGNAMLGLSGHETAASEAYEEAGIEGQLLEIPIGQFRYEKVRDSGERVPAQVTVYPCKVTRQHDEWPEKTQRTLQWLEPSAAAMRVEEPELKELILSFLPNEDDYQGVPALVRGSRRSNWWLKIRGLFRAVFNMQQR